MATVRTVVSVSLGSSSRDKEVRASFLGQDFIVKRVGTDGDPQRAIALIQELDGQVDCFGMGGTDLFLFRGEHRYIIKDSLKLYRAARKTPMVDGSGLKHSWEREVVRRIADRGILRKGMKGLLVSGVDRWGMAEALDQGGLQMTYGDLIFALDIPIALHSLRALDRMAKVMLPIATRLPFEMLYPTGEKQTNQQKKSKRAKYFEDNELIAGDFHYIRRYLPESLPGRVVLTNTTTEGDQALLQQVGIKTLVTTTPVMEGRSFGTNVLQGVMVCLLGKHPDDLTWDDYARCARDMGLEPTVTEF
ncbi:MAG TPA: quinate 5-dehydrogenase [bacterium]|nr:quinate 5-dehydrogenase [bacterium]